MAELHIRYNYMKCPIVADDIHDLENAFNHIVKENESYYTHIMEGSDDMPAHIKSSLVGCSLTIPIRNYQLNLGTWQGIYLCEFRNYGGQRKILATIYS